MEPPRRIVLLVNLSNKSWLTESARYATLLVRAVLEVRQTDSVQLVSPVWFTTEPKNFATLGVIPLPLQIQQL